MEISSSHEQGSMIFIPLHSYQLYTSEIKPRLQKLSQGINHIDTLIQALRQFKLFTSSKTLITCFNKDCTYFTELKQISKQTVKFKVLPLFQKMASFVLSLENHFKSLKIKILTQQINDSIQISKKQVIYILCLMALNLVPLQQYDFEPNRRQKFPFWNDFSFIFTRQTYKTRTILEYFDEHFNRNELINRNQMFIIRRNCVKHQVNQLISKFSGQPLSNYQIKENKVSIEDFTGQGKVDFANKFIGGGALHSGCVQQQLMFSNHPELFITGIFCQVMLPSESILMQGFRKFSKNSGYGWSTQYDGQQPLDQQTFKTQQYIIAIDAIKFFPNNKLSQFKKKNIDRQLLKAYAGFSNLPKEVHVITGNWGCGAFQGNIKLKFLIQWIACSMVGKKMIYCPFDSRQVLDSDCEILQKLKALTIDEIYNLLIRAGQQVMNINYSVLRIISSLLNQNLPSKYGKHQLQSQQ